MAPLFLDTNVAIYATGADREKREVCQVLLAEFRRFPRSGTTSAEVLQEILHVCLRQGVLSRAAAAMALLSGAVSDRIEPMLPGDVLLAANAHYPVGLHARDRVHVAVMKRVGIEDIVSSDSAFDDVPGIRRRDPLDFASWRNEVFGA